MGIIGILEFSENTFCFQKVFVILHAQIIQKNDDFKI